MLQRLYLLIGVLEFNKIEPNFKKKPKKPISTKELTFKHCTTIKNKKNTLFLQIKFYQRGYFSKRREAIPNNDLILGFNV